jgi:hypothetical protein
MARQRTRWYIQVTIAIIAIVSGVGLTEKVTESRASGGRVATMLDEAAPLREEVLRGAGGTYISRVLLERDSTLTRWPSRNGEPIRVWVEPNSTNGFEGGVRSAFGEWTAIGLPLRFIFVDRARDAEIRVRWTDRLDRKTGNTIWRVDRNGWMRGSDVMLATHLGDGRPLDGRSLRAIALHEVGHALGLAHSDDRHDVMAPLVRVAALSQGDRATARLIYTLPAGHLR